MPPRDLATLLAAKLAEADGVAGAEIAGPGFLNIRVEAGAQGAVAAQVVEAGASYGTTRRWPARRFNVEFISANPTGPMHLGHTRWAVVGRRHRAGSWRPPAPRSPGSSTSTTAATRWTSSARRWRRSRWAGRCPRTATSATTSPTSRGEVVGGEPAHRRPARGRADGGVPRGGLQAAARRAAGAARRRSARTSTCGSPSGACTTGTRSPGASTSSATRATCTTPTARCGCGPPTSATTRTGCCVRSNGELTYFASDTAYYVDKRERGFDVCLYLLGADHHGYVGRLRAMAACTGDDPSVTLEVLIGQLVKILRGGEEIRLSKRAGTIVTLQELVEMIGVDSLRYTLAALPRGLPADPRRRGDHPAGLGQPGLLRAVRPRPAVRDAAQRRRPRADAAAGRRVRPRAARAREGGRAAARAGRVPAGHRHRRAAPRAAPGGPLPGGHRVEVPPVLRRLPGAAHGRGGAGADPRRPAAAGRGDPDGRSPTACGCSGSPRRSGCNGARARGRLGARRRVLPRAGLAASPRGRQRPGPAAVVLDGPQDRRRRPRGRRRRPARRWSPSTARRPTSWTRRTSGRAPGRSARRSPATTSTTRARPSCARRSRAGSRRRGCASTCARPAS